jgi:hypothetical protein
MAESEEEQPAGGGLVKKIRDFWRRWPLDDWYRHCCRLADFW